MPALRGRLWHYYRFVQLLIAQAELKQLTQWRIGGI
jgi:hypothetical protein